MKAQASNVPSFSALTDSLHSAYFYDCYSVLLPTDLRSPFELYLNVVSRTPSWIDFFMNMRNKIVALLGLKDMGPLSGVDLNKPAQAYQIGDQAGIFKLLELYEHEVILGETDKHLDVKISVAKQDQPDGTLVSIATVVQVHRFIGRLYMLFVTPAHRIIAPAMLSRLL